MVEQGDSLGGSVYDLSHPGDWSWYSPDLAYAAGGVSPSVTEMPAAFDQVADALESHHLALPHAVLR